MATSHGSTKRTTDDHVFLSHSSEDVQVSTLLQNAIEGGGMRCWFAPRDVVPGQEYGEAIIDALKRSKVFVLVFSAQSEKSPHIRSEIERAASLDIPLIVFRVDATQPSDRTGFFLARHHWLDGSDGPSQERILSLVAAVRRIYETATGDTRRVTATNRASNRHDVRPKRKGDPVAQETQHRAIGIDIGGSKIRGCVIEFSSDDHPVVSAKEYVVDIKRPISARSVIDQVKAMIAEIYTVEAFGGSPPVGVGIAAAGQVDMRAGVLKFAPALGVRNLSLKSVFTVACPGVDVRVDNDVRCATRCELYLGSGRDFDSFVCIFVGTGVGSGIAIDKKILFGINYCAGEIGHTKIASDGPLCNCGQRGCLEAFVKAGALVDRARAKAIEWKNRGEETMLSEEADKNSPRSIASALEAGDAAAQEIADEVGQKLGVGIANYLNIINSGAIVLGGGITSGFFMHMSDGVSRGIRGNALSDVANTPIVHSQYSDDGAALGAALLFHPQSPWPFS